MCIDICMKSHSIVAYLQSADIRVLVMAYSCESLLKTSLLEPKIKTHSRVSAAKEDVRHTSVLFTGKAKSPFSTPHISITTGPISIKFKYFMLSIYTTLHIKFEENWLSS